MKDHNASVFMPMKAGRASGTVIAVLAILIVVLMMFSSVPVVHAQVPLNGKSSVQSQLPSVAATNTLPSTDVSGGVASNSSVTVINMTGGALSGKSVVPAFYSGAGNAGGYSFGSYDELMGIEYPIVSPYDAGVNTINILGNASISQNVSTWMYPLGYQGGPYDEGSVATSLHYVANFTRIYPPMIDYSDGVSNPSGGMGPNYSLQFNVPFLSTTPGVDFGINWYQSVIDFITVSGAGNPQDSNASYYIMQGSVWWSNLTSGNSHVHGSPYSWNYSNYNNLFVSPEHPFLISTWINISYAPSGTDNGSVFINEYDRLTGFLAEGGQNNVSYADHQYRTVWYNRSFLIDKGSVYPFPVFLTYYPGNGIEFGGVGNRQSVWGNYTATFGVAQYDDGTLLPMDIVFAEPSATGESSSGTNGIVISGQKTNPVDMPAYFPYTYSSNQSGGPLGSSRYNLEHRAMGSQIIIGTAFPSNASITAYAVYTHTYVSVVKNGSSFYVDFPGLHGMNSHEITVGLSLDYWSPIMLNFSAPGFEPYSITLSPYYESIPDFEVRSVMTTLVPVSQKMVYGFISIPLSYLSYMMGSYVFSHYPGIGRLDGNIYSTTNSSSVSQGWELLNDISNISANASSYFWLNVTGSGSYYNESSYMPSMIQMFLKVLWGMDWSDHAVVGLLFAYYYGLVFNNSFVVPYYVVVPSSESSIVVSAPALLPSTISVPSGSGVFERNISLGSFDIPLTFRFSSIPVTYNGTSPSISSVSMDGKTVWNGSSTDANVTVDVPLDSIAASDVSSFIYAIYHGTYTPGSSFSGGLPSFYYNASFIVTPSSSQYNPIVISRNMMLFNYSLYALATRLGEDPVSTTQTFPFSFHQARVSVGGSYYSVVNGYLYGVYNLTGQKFVLSGVLVQFVQGGVVVDTAVTGSNGYFSANMTFAPASIWGANKTIPVQVEAGDLQFESFNGTLYLHANQVEWYNASLVFISTVNLLGFDITVPAWFLEHLLGWGNAGIYVVVLYFLMLGAIGIGAATACVVVIRSIGKRVSKTGRSKY
jgi:hypothetical protein